MPRILDLCHSLDPVAFARERLRFLPGPTQSIVLASRSNQVILNCTRQWSKSTLTAAQAVFTAWHEPESLILVMSPTARQSSELVRKAAVFLSRLGVRPLATAVTKFRSCFPTVPASSGSPVPKQPTAATPESAFFSSTKPPVWTKTSTSPCSPSSPSAVAISGS